MDDSVSRSDNQRPDIARVRAHIRALTASPPQGDEVVVWARTAAERYSWVDGCAPELPSDTRILEVNTAGVKGEWVCAPNADPARRILYLHGGGWIAGGPRPYRHLAALLSALAGISVLVLDYRLAPENPFPTALDDCVAAYRWLLENGPDGAGPANRIAIAGDSAGGNLGLATVFRCRASNTRFPDALLPISPVFDMTFSSPSMSSRGALDPLLSYESLCGMAQMYVQDGTPLEHPEISPLFGDLGGLPPTLIQVGDHEVLLDDSLRFAEKARAAGSRVEVDVWPEMMHVFQCFHDKLPEGRHSLRRMADFIKALN